MEFLKEIVGACDYFFEESKKNVSKTNKKVKKVMKSENKGLEDMEEGDLENLDKDKNHQGAIVTRKNIEAFKELKKAASDANKVVDDADKNLMELWAAPETNNPIWVGSESEPQNQVVDDPFINDFEEGRM